MTHPPPDGDGWYACHFPERPHERYTTRFKPGCPKCWIAFEAAGRRGDFGQLRRLNDDGTFTPVEVRDWDATREWWHGFSLEEAT